MKLLASSTLLWGKDIEEIGAVVYNHNLRGLELWAEQVWFSQMRVRDIRRVARRFDLEITFHAASWDLNICSLNEGIRRQSVEEIVRSFALAASIEATNVTVHPGRRTLTEEWTAWHEEALQKSLDYLEEAAKTYGVTLSLELMEEIKKEFVTSPLQINRLVDGRSSAVQTTFDAAHIAPGKDILATFAEMSRINKIHLSDSTKANYHVALGEGELLLERFIGHLQSGTYPVVLEGYDTSTEAILLQKHLRYLNACAQPTAKEMKS
ncbi:sugar phosphate isomerase/epimerase family protein [Halalkalibacter oceani]|uniref:Sugar phosphate isomerase/epimerase n=1 Tax=Halalkalibacter oceani TaxID=1653776 RepID=A0A9X2IP28_9BACI|nr:sugar phosphate isomerase/epimerase family protein [Halalkalibacter oceani]MCM3714022.1 sugar phosphate isomerase/epimerase [Halalkalibacter oceani]MCM3760488.1 sugar phosphate isomerase/epimerase [Halalkalibacter oceani]